MKPPQAARTTPKKAMVAPTGGRIRRSPKPKTINSNPANNGFEL
jgi:hypothetical protein